MADEVLFSTMLLSITDDYKHKYCYFIGFPGTVCFSFRYNNIRLQYNYGGTVSGSGINRQVIDVPCFGIGVSACEPIAI